MYKCKPCGASVGPNLPELRHIVKGPDGQIIRELRVCPACHEVLKATALAELTRKKDTPAPFRRPAVRAFV